MQLYTSATQHAVTESAIIGSCLRSCSCAEAEMRCSAQATLRLGRRMCWPMCPCTPACCPCFCARLLPEPRSMATLCSKTSNTCVMVYAYNIQPMCRCTQAFSYSCSSLPEWQPCARGLWLCELCMSNMCLAMCACTPACCLTPEPDSCPRLPVPQPCLRMCICALSYTKSVCHWIVSLAVGRCCWSCNPPRPW